MGLWTWPAYVGILGGTLLFLVVLVPVVVWQYRHYGILSWARLLGAAAVSVYVVALVAYTLLPLPSGDLVAWCAEHGHSHPQLHLGRFVTDIRENTRGMTLGQALRTATVLQVVLNVVLFIPFGVILRGFFRWRWWTTTLAAFCVSLLIETTQFTGIFGLIPCEYRLGDVDDLLMNTLGGFLGALVAPLVLRWMPRADDLERRRGQERPVTVWRRWLGMALDLSLATVAAVVLTVGYRAVVLAGGGTVPDGGTWLTFLLTAVVPFLVVFAIPPFVGTGASPGQRVVWLAPVRGRVVDLDGDGDGDLEGGAGGVDGVDGAGAEGRAPVAPLGRRLVRAAVPGGVWCVLTDLAAWPVAGERWASFAGVAAAVGWALAAVAVAVVPFTRGRRGLSGVVAGLDVIDARDDRAPRT